MGFLIGLLLLMVLWCVAGFLGAWTGTGQGRIWRRVVLPAITTLIGIIGLWSLWAIFLMARAGALSLGYGIPDPQTQPEPRDSGSVIGRFWWSIFTNDGFAESAQNMKKTGIATRGTIGFIEGVSIIAIPWISGGAGAWSLWILAVLLLCANNILFGELVKKEGSIRIFGKDLLKEEILIHGNDTFIITSLILLCR